MTEFFLTYLSKALNAYLNLDSESVTRFKKLNGKIVTINLLPFNWTFQCHFTEEGVVLQRDELLAADTKISGTPLQFLAISFTKNNRHQFFAKDAAIEGDALIGQQVAELFDQLEIDWEEHLSKFLGDIPAYHTNRVFSKMHKWLRKTEKSFALNIDEFCHEELKWYPPKEALQDFFIEVDTLRADVDRVEIKMQHLEERLLHDGIGVNK